MARSHEKTSPGSEEQPFDRLGSRLPHEARLGVGRFAVEQIMRRDEYKEKLAEARMKLDELDMLQTGGFVSRLRQRGALKSWLQRHEFPNHKFARSMLTYSTNSLGEQHEQQGQAVDIELGYVRELFDTFSTNEKKYADLFLRQHGLPEEIIAACDSTTGGENTRRNLIDWLATPNEENPGKNANTEQLERTLIWNALHTESVAANTELVSNTMVKYEEAIKRRVLEGRLDAAFANTPFVVDKVVVGDILDRRFLGYEGPARRGEYSREKKELLIWPYELPEEADTEEVVRHELTHAKGGFKTGWIDEAYTERFNLIILGLSPDHASNVYTHDRFSIKTLQEAAPEGMTDTVASAYYVGSDPELNERSLREEYKRAYRGIDVLGIIDKAFESFTEIYTSKGAPVPDANRRDGLSAVVLASLHVSYHSQAVFEHPQLAGYAEEKFRKSADDAHEREVEAVAYTVAADFYAQVAQDFKDGKLAPAPVKQL